MTEKRTATAGRSGSTSRWAAIVSVSGPAKSGMRLGELCFPKADRAGPCE
jgi:hypothetical protein